jgi:hypothetical protein
MIPGTGINPGNPKSTKISFFVPSVSVGVLKAFFNSIFGNSPNIFSSTKVTFGHLHYFFSSSFRGYIIY